MGEIRLFTGAAIVGIAVGVDDTGSGVVVSDEATVRVAVIALEGEASGGGAGSVGVTFPCDNVEDDALRWRNQ